MVPETPKWAILFTERQMRPKNGYEMTTDSWWYVFTKKFRDWVNRVRIIWLEAGV